MSDSYFWLYYNYQPQTGAFEPQPRANIGVVRV